MDSGALMVLIHKLLLATLMATACAPTFASTRPPEALEGTDGAQHTLTSSASPTVLVFFSSHCPCMTAHDARLVALADEYGRRGVRFFAVDSEVDADAARDRDEARSRHYSFPILVDRGGHAAQAFDAEYATYTVVLDTSGRITYRGGIDDERIHMTSAAIPYVHDALDDVLSGRTVRRSRADALGCALRKW